MVTVWQLGCPNLAQRLFGEPLKVEMGCLNKKEGPQKVDSCLGLPGKPTKQGHPRKRHTHMGMCFVEGSHLGMKRGTKRRPAII